MNKTAIKNFAVWARRKLISDITYKAGMLGITDSGIAEPLPISTKDLQFFDIGTKDYAEVSGNEISQRKALVDAIKRKEKSSKTYKEAFEYIAQEVAYTWFNRLIAIRFMEVNDYLPSGIRVLSSENPAKSEPDFVTTPFDTDIEFTPFEQDKVIQLKDENKLDELFRMLFIKECNKLHEILPELFEKTDDYTELLLTISFTDKDGVVYHLVHDIEEKDFDIAEEGQVEIIGWMYQYYNSEPKDELINAKKQYKKNDIPFVTQIFTSDWIVKYMVENSLGRYYLENGGNSALKNNWKFFLENDTPYQEPQNINPENIKVIDPCMGSGHILVYSFDLLMQIYENQGYAQRDAAKCILENNLYGLDVDKRAYQLAYFSILMKARQYNRRILTLNIKTNLYCFFDSDIMDNATINKYKENKHKLLELFDNFKDANELGSLIKVDFDEREINALLDASNEILREDNYDIFDYVVKDEVEHTIIPLLKIGEILAKKYAVVVTNPPYMSAKYMTPKLKQYVSDIYSNYKADLFAAFIVRCSELCASNGHIGMLTPYVWMFIQSYEKLREYIYQKMTISSLVQLEYNAFESACVPVAAYTFRNIQVDIPFGAIRLSEFKGIEVQEIKTLEAVRDKECTFRYISYQNKLRRIPGSPLAYWVSEAVLTTFDAPSVEDCGSFSYGVFTCDNVRFLRLWHEVSAGDTDFVKSKEQHKTWRLLNKGGTGRKWYGNMEYVINYGDEGDEIKQYRRESGQSESLPGESFYFQPHISWSLITSASLTFRYYPKGMIFDISAPSMFNADKTKLLSTLAVLNSKIGSFYLPLFNPTMNNTNSDIKRIPYIISSNVQNLTAQIAEKNIELSKREWDSFETSWDFRKHPLIPLARERQEQENSQFANSRMEKFGRLSWHYDNWEQECKDRFNQLKANEEELNRIFIDIYGLQDELTPEVEDRDVTVRKADLQREIKSLISYAVGCMLGRYSLDAPGLAYAGGEWDNTKYSTFIPDDDNCLPITDEEYFEDDIVGRFVKFIETVYGKDTLEDNLDFIAKALGNKGNTSREVIRNYFLNDFIKDHIKIYQKRPIYWLYDSGKQNGFKALVYMHRYNADTTGNMRVEYLHRMQRVYEKELERMQEVIDNSRDNKEISAATKRKEKLQKQLKETKEYDAKVAHLALSRIGIDLDDGVKVNYEKVQTASDGTKLDILAKI